MYSIRYSSTFKKQYKKIRYHKKAVAQLRIIVEMLAEGEPLHRKYHDHPLQGQFIGIRECHVLPDLLLLYTKEKDSLTLLLVSIGSHSEIFG